MNVVLVETKWNNIILDKHDSNRLHHPAPTTLYVLRLLQYFLQFIKCITTISAIVSVVCVCIVFQLLTTFSWKSVPFNCRPVSCGLLVSVPFCHSFYHRRRIALKPSLRHFVSDTSVVHVSSSRHDCITVTLARVSFSHCHDRRVHLASHLPARPLPPSRNPWT